MEESEARITRTLLSNKPKEESVPVSLLIGMVIVFTAMLCWRNPEIFRLLSASREQAIARHEWWRLSSTIVVHADASHLAVNTCLVVFFGYLLYGYFGFWIYPVAMVILASLTNLLSLLTYPADVVLIGASGLAYLMASFWLVLYSSIERTIPLQKRLLRTTGIALIVFVPTTVQPEVSYRTHFIACGIGSAAALLYFLARRRQIRSLEVVEPEPPIYPD